MATRFDNTLFPSNSTDAIFRAWASFIHNTLVTTGGWTNTGDTGQVDLTTVAFPTGTNDKEGYKIYAMADALQATSPVYMRIDYGSSSASLTPGIWLTIGTGSNGSGTITGIVFNGGSVTAPTIACGGNNAVTVNNSYGSADTNRVQIMMFVNSSQNTRGLMFSLERSKDANGADTGHGLILVGSSNSGSTNLGRYIIMAGGTQPADEGGIQFILSSANPTTFGGNVGVGLSVPMAGYALQPGTGIVVVRVNDFAAESSFSMSVYGATRTYQLAHTQNPNVAAAAAQSSSSRTGIRYD